jgi:virginiamycin B lyase
MIEAAPQLIQSKRKTMKSRKLSATLMILAASSWSPCFAASIAGIVRDPQGRPRPAVFVEARNDRTNTTSIVLSDARGRYRFDQLAAGEYRVSTEVTGFRSDGPGAVTLAAKQKLAYDVSLIKSPVRWNELSIYQARELWPASPAKDKIFAVCFTCHGFQTRMATTPRDAEGWLGRVKYMQAAMNFGLADRLNDAQADDIAAYLNGLFGESSVLPKSPQDARAYQSTLRPIGGEAADITFVEYDMPAPSRMPFSAAPDKNGNLWIPNFGVANQISRLDPSTGEIQDFAVPNVGTAAVHSAVPAADGSVWLTEQGANKIGRFDPQTQRIVEFQDAYVAGKLGYGAGSKHTVRLDPGGNVWSSGNPLTRFDPVSQKFTRFEEIPSTYDVEVGNDGNIWFTKPDTSQIGMVDWKTLKVSLWTAPTAKSFPRRLQIGADGIVWFGEFNAGKLGRFDPKTQAITEYPLPGPEPTPYGLGIDADHQIWYASYNMDVLGRFDPETGKTVEYPFPHSENTIREFFRDPQGRMWYGSPSNNKVGYFTLRKGSPRAVR